MVEKAKVDPEKILFARMIAALSDAGYFKKGGTKDYTDLTKRVAKMRDRMPVDEEDILAAALRAVEVRDSTEASSLLNRIGEIARDYPDKLESALSVFNKLDEHMREGKAPPFEWQEKPT